MGRRTTTATVLSGGFFFFPHHLIRIVTTLFEISRLNVANMQETIASNTKVYKDSLDTWFKINNLAFVNVADVVVLAGSLNIEFFKPSVFDDRDPILFGLRCVD